MKQELLKEKFSIYKLDIDESETRFQSAQALTDYFKYCIDEHPIARFIAEFDHYSHTRGLQDGQLADSIIDARNVVFCFGSKLPTAEMLALQPRSIGIAETDSRFTISFHEAPVAIANDTMESWMKSITDRQPAA